MLIPVGMALDDIISKGQWKSLMAIGAVSFLCMTQQIYFSLGEVFSFWRCNSVLNGENLFNHGVIYEAWEVSPLIFLMDGRCGPLLLSFSGLSNWMLLLCLTALCGFLVGGAFLNVRRENSC